MQENHKIIIIGAGYAGLQAAIELEKENYKCILIDKNDCHELLPELPHKITKKNLNTQIPFAELLENRSIQFVKAEVKQINYQSKKVILKDQTDLDFDYLILALGSQTNYFNIPGLKENSIGFINTNQVKELLEKLENNFAQAKNLDPSSAEYKELLSVIVGGGGLTGVEVAAELIYYLSDLARKHNLNSAHIKIYIIEALNALMAAGDKDLSNKVTEFFKKEKQIELVFGQPIEEAFEDSVRLKDGKIIKAKAIVWTGGIRGNAFLENEFIDENGDLKKFPIGRGFRIEVDEFLRVKERPNTYAIGDNALFLDPETKQPFPLNGQAASKHGIGVAHYLISAITGEKLKEKKFELQGVLVSLGPEIGTGALEIGKKKIILPTGKILGKMSRQVKTAIEARYKYLDIRR